MLILVIHLYEIRVLVDIWIRKSF